MSVDSKPKVYWSKTWELPWGAVLTVEEHSQFGWGWFIVSGKIPISRKWGLKDRLDALSRAQRALREYHRQLSHIMSYELETAMEEAWPESMKGRMKP